MEAERSTARRRIGAIWSAGLGQPRWAELDAAAAALSWRERRAARRALRRGEPAADAASARYAVALVPLLAAMTARGQRPRIRLLYVVIALVYAANAVSHVVDGDTVLAAMYAPLGVLFLWQAVWPDGRRYRHVLAEDLRLAGLPPEAAPALTPIYPSAAMRVFGLASLFLFFWAVSAIGVAVGAAGAVRLPTILLLGCLAGGVCLASANVGGLLLRRQWRPVAVPVEADLAARAAP